MLKKSHRCRFIDFKIIYDSMKVVLYIPPRCLNCHIFISRDGFSGRGVHYNQPSYCHSRHGEQLFALPDKDYRPTVTSAVIVEDDVKFLFE